MISFPWDNTSSTVLDRNVSSDTLAEKYFDMLAGGNSGIYAPVGAQGSVSPGTGMTVVVQPVEGVIEGRIYSETDARTLVVQASEAQDRIDTVVIRRNKADRIVDLYVVKGTAASTPVRPALTRSGDIYEVGIADLFIAATTTSITQQRITDTRSETARCQIVPVVGNIDTTSMFNQYQAALDAYLDLVQQAIDETLAGNLQSQIDASEAIIAKHDGNFAGAYSASSTYALNTFVIYANDLYKCTTAITVAEAWTAGHWTKVSVGAELSSLITNLNAVSDVEVVDIKNSSNISIGKMVKLGKLRILSVFSGADTNNADGTITTISDVPVAQLYSKTAYGGSNTLGSFRVDIDGKIYLLASSGAPIQSSYVVGSITFVVN